MSVIQDGQSRLDGSAGGAQHADGSAEEGYWAVLLQEGEIAAQDGPPPWVAETLGVAGGARSRNGDRPDEAHEAHDWRRAAEALANGQCCELFATGYNRGGLLVQFGQLIGFVPTSHLIGFPASADQYERQEAMISRLNQTLKLRVVELDRARNKLILSERAAVQEATPETLLNRLRPGDIVRGQVSNLCRFGAFVDLGGFEGLVHISELSWGRVNQPSDVVRVGDEVQLHVVEVNREERKIQLSLKRLQPDPWKKVVEHYKVGQLAYGEVTNVVSFGAFTRLEEGVEGLIHISELAEGNFLHPRNVVKEGDWVEVRVLNIDPINRRIGLSLRHTHQHPAQEERSTGKAAPREPRPPERAGMAAW